MSWQSDTADHSKPKAEAAGGSVDDRVPKQPSNVSPGLKVAPSHLASLSSTQKDGPVPVPKDGPVAAKKDGASVSSLKEDQGAGFRDSYQERKNILKGNFHLNYAGGQSDIRGTSLRSHRISAAYQPSHVNKHLVYVGKLASDTSCDDVRCHLSDIQINDVADVIYLSNGRNHTSRFKNASFCVSLGSELSVSKMFDSEVWASGVIVRPFRPAKSNRNRSYVSRKGKSRSSSRPSHQRQPGGTKSRLQDSYQGHSLDRRRPDDRDGYWNREHRWNNPRSQPDWYPYEDYQNEYV